MKTARVYQLHPRVKPVERRTPAEKAQTVLKFHEQLVKAMGALVRRGFFPVSTVIDQTRPRIHIAHDSRALQALGGYSIGRRQVTNGIVCRRYGAQLHDVQIIWEEETKC